MQIILFGLSGAGKTYIGNILAEHFHYYFWDADQALPLVMQEAVAKKQLFTQAMRDQFTQEMIEKIIILQKQYPSLVIAQALYKEKNRLQIQQAFPKAKFIYVKAEETVIHKRLKERNNAVDIAYAKTIQQNFEEPSLSHSILFNNNNEEEAAIQQLKAFASQK